MTQKPIIEISGLSKTYRETTQDHQVLQDLDAVVYEGEFVVLLGRSGSGKSTFLNLISGIDIPDQGRVIVNGVCLNTLSEHDRTLFRRHHIGFVFQAFNLIPTLTVEENLLLPLELISNSTDHQRDRVLSFLDRVGLANRVSSFPDQLSGGEQQRVAIARALVHDPQVILADEPTGNLDLTTGREVLGILDQSVREAGKTLIMVTHSSEVIGLADRILTIREGRFVESRSEP